MDAACLRRKLAPSRNSDDDVNDEPCKVAVTIFGGFNKEFPSSAKPSLALTQAIYEQSYVLVFIDIYNITELNQYIFLRLLHQITSWHPTPASFLLAMLRQSIMLGWTIAVIEPRLPK